jgi:uncharacterized protein YsxB (DUF464 family)
VLESVHKDSFENKQAHGHAQRKEREKETSCLGVFVVNVRCWRVFKKILLRTSRLTAMHKE